MNKFISLVLIFVLAGLFASPLSAQNKSTASKLSKITELTVKPSVTDSTIKHADLAHLIMYNASIPQGKLLLFLPGSNGIAVRGPKDLFETAIEQGYRVINLSYINKQAVAGICRGQNLADDWECTEKFREQRIFGTKLTNLIPDEPQDAIVNRLVKLLAYLSTIDKAGNWDMYLDGDKPNWNIITVSGQSQGGGMAAFIAKQKIVNRVVTFSGGWDYSKGKEIAKWYSNESITPANRWFGVYHSKEPQAAVIAKTYAAMAIPENQTYPLKLKIREGRRAHGEGIRNTVYKKMWLELFGDGFFD